MWSDSSSALLMVLTTHDVTLAFECVLGDWANQMMNSGFFFFLFFVFFGGQIFTTWLQTTIQCNSYKLSLWKKCAKIVRFQWQDFWNCHSQTIGSSRLPKYSRILKTFYFPLWSVSKFRLADSSCGWSSMWLHQRIEKKTKTKLQLLSIVSWNRDHLSIVS